ncbi:hypothetical protein F4781DRAFT_379590 [Annulohypoxylon bovei var. microspora]|nr:hypothetical protein F4781DRAFT_379590 [Annulohypoxylon bovei var. microspora]
MPQLGILCTTARLCTGLVHPHLGSICTYRLAAFSYQGCTRFGRSEIEPITIHPFHPHGLENAYPGRTGAIVWPTLGYIYAWYAVFIFPGSIIPTLRHSPNSSSLKLSR